MFSYATFAGIVWVGVTLGLLNQYALAPWLDRRKLREEKCGHHRRYRQGGRDCRTEFCADCHVQWPIKQVYCPGCRSWHDPDAAVATVHTTRAEARGEV